MEARAGSCVKQRSGVANAVTLSHPKDGYKVLMFFDASDNPWGSFLTQVPSTELEDSVEVTKNSHEPFGFDRHLSWLTVAVGDRGQGEVHHHEHVSTFGVLVVGSSAHLH